MTRISLLLSSFLLFGCVVLIGQVDEVENVQTTFDFVRGPLAVSYPTGLARKELLGADRVGNFPNVALPMRYLLPKLSPIQDQKQCGSCWAHSIIATIWDTYLNVLGIDPGSLSQQWLVDCSRESSGCNGGYFDSFQDAVVPEGAPSWASYPYVGQDQQCRGAQAPLTGIKAWHMLDDGTGGPRQYDIAYVLAVLHRPVSITVYASGGPWMRYKSGIYNGCKRGNPDHMITIVGYDTEGIALDAQAGNLPAGKGVWTLRNSWSKTWGEAGYMRTKMTDGHGHKCNAVAQDAAYVELPGEPAKMSVP